jgi:hypothetical protein
MANKLSPHGKTVVEGSVSCGTLRTPDLLRAFASELEAIKPFGEKDLIARARHAADMVDQNDQALNPTEHHDLVAAEALVDLRDVLESAAPEGMYFGTTEGDGSDFGFWRETEED